MQRKKKKGDVIALKGSDGSPRVVLDASTDSLPSITLKGEGGAALILEVDGENPRLVMMRKGGKHAAVVAVNGEGSVISLYDKKGLPSVRISFDPETGTSEIALLSKGQIKWLQTT